MTVGGGGFEERLWIGMGLVWVFGCGCGRGFGRRGGIYRVVDWIIDRLLRATQWSRKTIAVDYRRLWQHFVASVHSDTP